jgi:elongation factor Ts
MEAMEISAKQVMELRQATGMPMMQCKRALLDSQGDFEKAMENLRKQGLKTAEKRAGRSTGEGLLAVRASQDGKTGLMLLVQCETEPVKNTPKFVEFVDTLADRAAAEGVGDRDALLALDLGEGETAEAVLRNLVGLIGENMQVGDIARFHVEGPGSVGTYVHNDRKQGALVAITGKDDPETAKELCQHVVFAKPTVLDRSDVDPEDVEKELAFLREQVAEDPALSGKPEKAREGIVRGRLEKNFYGERVLREQAWYRENSKKVSAVLAERGVEVQAFRRFAPGA